jgi:NADH-quinone oxidoreductase subunit B
MGPGGALQHRRHVVDAGRRFWLWFFDAGLACCAVEVLAATAGVGTPGAVSGRLGALPAAAGPADADVLLVSGTVTAKLAPAVRGLYEQLPEPRYVVAVGACASSGGPYWDSYCVVPGAAELVPVDLYVPGCPPRPQALLAALRTLVPG